MVNNVLLLIFALGFLGCVLATPLATRIASWAGAIDRPDHFRRVHKGAIPRLGGLGLACGLALAFLPIYAGGNLDEWGRITEWVSHQGWIVLAGAIVLAVGAIDDTRGMSPRAKLLGQAAAVALLMAGGIRIKGIAILGVPIPLSYAIPLELWGRAFIFDPVSIVVTMLWFLGCMNVWNLIDGMDGLASGVGLLVAGTMMLVALRQENAGSAALAAALAGSLAGFLLYNWHPACIFLGDSGSLLIGLTIGVIGVQDSMKGTATVSILFPILAMGLPISDTAMAIFRRWVRNLPLSSADRQHLHHLLLGLGLTPRQAAFYLYAFSAFLCGVVLLGVALNNPVRGEFLALILGGSGCLAFLVILTSRRDELGGLVADLNARFERKRQEKVAATLTWEAIQKMELCVQADAIWEILRGTAVTLGCDSVQFSCRREGREIVERSAGMAPVDEAIQLGASGPTATFRLSRGQGLQLTVSLRQSTRSAAPEPDIAFRSLQRLSLAAAERIERILADRDDRDSAGGAAGPSNRPFGRPEPAEPIAPVSIMARDEEQQRPLSWIRWALGLETAA